MIRAIERFMLLRGILFDSFFLFSSENMFMALVYGRVRVDTRGAGNDDDVIYSSVFSCRKLCSHGWCEEGEIRV